MGLPSLGYEPDRTIPKVEVAKIQLVEAIALFVECKFIPAVTLAGAAEEILGKLVAKNSEIPVIRESTRAILDLRERLGLTVMGGKSEKEMVDEWNRARNELKHIGACEVESIELNPCDEAYWMIKRALGNAQKLNVAIPNAQDFENWVMLNVNM